MRLTHFGHACLVEAAGTRVLEFLRRIGPATAVPVHDGLLSAQGRASYLQHVSAFGPDETTVRDLGDGAPWDAG